MTWIEIQPQDVWLFRDGKPFSAGEDHSARSVFPPSPLTVQGALRQKISVSLGVSLREYVAETESAQEAIGYIGRHGELSDLGAFTMRGPFISLRTDTEIVPLFPVPADLLAHENTDTRIFDGVFITAPAETSVQSNLRGFQFPQVREGYENLPAFWMTQPALQNYLVYPSKIDLSWFVPEFSEDYRTASAAYWAGKHIWHRRLIYENENRFGVSTNALTSYREEGQLYQVGFVRPLEGIGLLVSVTNDVPGHLLTGAISIGGEQRKANAAIVDNVTLPTHPKTLSGCFKVVFLTPAYFDDGWQPKDGDWSALFGHEVTLRSAALYRPLKIGGWNSATGTARPMHNYVAPGSVYYFKTVGTFDAPDVLTQNPPDINAKVLGFGQYAISEWSTSNSEQD